MLDMFSCICPWLVYSELHPSLVITKANFMFYCCYYCNISNIYLHCVNIREMEAATHTIVFTLLSQCSSQFTCVNLTFLSFSAYYTVELFLRIIRRARHAIAVGLNMVEQCTIGICLTAWKRLLISVNTLIVRSLMISAFRHEVAIVLPCPGGWAAGLSWDHQDCLTCWGIAHSTGNIVLMSTL